MPDDKPGDSTPDDVTNLKAEFNRKLSNYESELTKQKETTNQLLAQIQSMSFKSQSQPPSTTKNLGDLMYENPEAAAQQITNNATQAAVKATSDIMATQRQEQQILFDIVSEFPEASNNEHELTKCSRKILNSYEVNDQKNPKFWKMAVNEAALDLGIKPKSKRTSTEEDFSLNSKGSSSISSANYSKDKGKTAITEDILNFAALLGRPVNDPKYLESLESFANRKNWTKYE